MRVRPGASWGLGFEVVSSLQARRCDAANILWFFLHTLLQQENLTKDAMREGLR